MSNPFAAGGGDDPFAELPSAQPLHAGIKPARRAPPRPGASANPFSSTPPAAVQPADPFDFLAAAAPAPAVAPAASTQPPTGAAVADDDDVFGLFSAAPAPPAARGADSSSSRAAAAHPPPPPPSYADTSSLPPPPAYDAAASMPPPPPPSYEQVMLGVQQQQRPACAAPAPPPGAGASGLGPLTAARPARAAPPTPARPAPAVPARAAPRAPPAAAADCVVQQMAAVGLSSPSRQAAGAAAGSASCVAATTGNVGAAPKGSIFGSQQVHDGELCAQLRLPPLNPKAAAPLKLLAAGLGSVFAGPADEATPLLLQWAPNRDGSTLPAGAAACPREDHDAGAAAVLGPPGAAASAAGAAGASKGRISCVLFGAAPGWLWAGSADGRVHAWAVQPDGSLAAHLHSWQAHSSKVKALAVSPCGRLFTGASSMKMWSYGSPAFGEAGPPRLLRQLKAVDSRSGVGSCPHSKVVALGVSAGGRVLWSVGKSSVSLWSTHNGEHLGSLSDSSSADAFGDGAAAAAAAAAGVRPGYASPYTAQLAGSGSGLGSGQINPRHGLDTSLLDAQFERPSAEVLSEADGFDDERDAASVAYNAAIKGAVKAGKLFNKLTKMAAAKMNEGRADGLDADPVFGSGTAPGSGGGLGGSAAAAAAAGESPDPGLEDKVERWGAIKKLAAAADGSMWLSYKSGLLEKYSEAGRLLWRSSSGSGTCSSSSTKAAGGGFNPAGGITALTAVGSSVWVGDQAGSIWVLAAGSAALQRSWRAHVFPVSSIAAGGHLVFSLCKAGNVRAWPAAAPPPQLTAAWRADAADCLQQQSLQVLAGTWNVNETKPSRHGLELWLGDRARQAHIVMIGLQEVEMGTGSVALDAVYSSLAKSRLEAGTQAAQAWVAAIADVLASKGTWRRIALRQMSGILAVVFVRAELVPHVGEVATASVACGVMGYGGNKGGVAVSFSLFRRRLVLVSSHFAAHQDKVDARNADYAKIVRHLHFHNVPTAKAGQQQAYEEAAVTVPGASSSDVTAAADSSGMFEEDWGAGMKDAEVLVWAGDFNYRVDAPAGFNPDTSDPERPVNEQLYRFVLSQIAARQHASLLTGDQCSREMARGAIFHGLAEGPIAFLPTYKFEKGRESSALQPFYDQGEKMRVPAWTDRILFRGSAPQAAALAPNAAVAPADVRVSLLGPAGYSAVLEVNDSDHKPVYAQLQLQLPWYQQQQLRSTSLQRLWQVAELGSGSASGCVSLAVDQQQLMLTGSHTPSSLVLSNTSSSRAAAFMLLCASSSSSSTPAGRGSSGPGLPSWLEVTPAAGVMQPGGQVRLKVQGSKGAAWGGHPGGGLGCELRVVAVAEGSIESSRWPAACVGQAPAVSVMLL